MKSFEIDGEITDIEIIATGSAIRDIERLRKRYGPGRCRKLKGLATIRLRDGSVRRAELHWYEAQGIRRKEFRRKRYLDWAYENFGFKIIVCPLRPVCGKFGVSRLIRVA